MDIVFFDLETTGKSPITDRICQVSTFKTTEDFSLIDGTVRNILINPECEIPKEATEIHKITNEIVKDKPTFKSVSNSLYSYLSGCILGGFNIKYYDVPMLSEEFGRCGITYPIDNTIPIIDGCKIFKNKERRDLSSALKFYCGIELEGAHDAQNDNFATLEVVKAQSVFYGMDCSDMIEFCKKDDSNFVDFAGKIILIDGVPCFSFGRKTKGVPVKNDIGFAKWMLDNDFPINTKNVVRSIIGL
jgi:DNA polymerase-3 subunit epsilon